MRLVRLKDDEGGVRIRMLRRQERLTEPMGVPRGSSVRKRRSASPFGSVFIQ